MYNMYDNTKLHNVTVYYNIYILRTCIGNLFSFRIQPEVQNPTQNQAGRSKQKMQKVPTKRPIKPTLNPCCSLVT